MITVGRRMSSACHGLQLSGLKPPSVRIAHNRVVDVDAVHVSSSSVSQDVTSETLTKADIFSLGVMMYQICSGRNINERGDGGLYRKLREGSAEGIRGLAPGLNDLIQKCLHLDHTQRPSARDILADKVLLQVSVSEKKLLSENKQVRAQLAQREADLSAACATIAQLRDDNEVEPMKENSRHPGTKRESPQGSHRPPLADAARFPRAGTTRAKKLVHLALMANNHDT